MLKNLLFCLLLLFGSILTLTAQNCLSNLSLETECVDAFNFTAFISFEHSLEDSDMIGVLDQNGVDYGFYNPNEQPLILDVLLPNSLMNEVGFTLISMESPNCAVQTPSALVFCNGCQLDANTISADCISDTDNYLLRVELVNSGAMPVSSYYIEHDATATMYGPFDSVVPGETQTIEVELPSNQQGSFTISDPNRLCHAIISASNECNPAPSCTISNLGFDTECLGPDDVKVMLNFDYEAIPGNSVVVSDNHGNSYGSFQANQQPIEFELTLADAITNEMSFTVASAQQPECAATTEQKTVSCYSCEIEATLVSADCIPNSDNYKLTLEVKSMGPSTIEHFALTHTATGQFIGMFSNYAPSRPRLIAVTLSTDFQGEFTVSDANYLCEQMVQVEVDCSTPLCYLDNITYETECVDANNFTAHIQFDFEAEVTDLVSVTDILGNDYGLYDATEQPISVAVTLQDTDSRDFGFILTCSQDENCSGETALQTITCESCDMEASVVSTACIPQEDSYTLTLNVSNNGSTSTENFKLTHTETGQFIGTFNNYNANNSRTIAVNLSTDIQGNFTVSDESGTCETIVNAQVDCSSALCYISNVSFDTECIDANNFTALVSFDYETEITDLVSITDSNGKDYGLFDATQQPLSVDVVLQDSDSRDVGLIVTCSQDADCLSESPLQTIDCIDCKLLAEELHHECEANGESYHVAIKLTNNGETENAKYSVTHTATGQFIGMYSHFGTSNERYIDFYNPIDMQGDFTIAINETNCSTNLNIAVECTPEVPCEVASIEVISSDCNEDGTYNLIAAYEISNSDDNFVSVSLNGGNPELHNNTGMLNLENLTKEGNSNYESIEICSNSESDCCKAIEFIAPDCLPDEEECELTIISVDYECDTEMNNDISLLLTVDGNHANDFLIKVNGIETGSGSLTQTVTEVGPIESNEEGAYSIEVISTDDQECYAMYELTDAICQPDHIDCIISNIDVSNLECTSSEEYEMLLNFNFDSEVDMDFVCKVNGIEMLSDNTSALPLKMAGMTSAGSNQMEVITICINGLAEECCIDYTYEKPNCLSNSVVDNSLLDGVSISPNPATDVVTINYIPQDVIGLTIVDNMGRTIKNIIDVSDVRLDVSNYQSGLYTVQFFTADNRVSSKRFMKL